MGRRFLCRIRMIGTPQSPLRGGVDRNCPVGPEPPVFMVAPSRGRGSKHRQPELDARRSVRRVAPSRGRGSKPCAELGQARPGRVAPSRGRGSKPFQDRAYPLAARSPLRGGVDRNTDGSPGLLAPTSRPFAGAWIETPTPSSRPARGCGRPFAGAWIETPQQSHPRRSAAPSPLRGGVDRNTPVFAKAPAANVAPSRGRGSKLCHGCRVVMNGPGRPFAGGVDRNRTAPEIIAVGAESPLRMPPDWRTCAPSPAG